MKRLWICAMFFPMFLKMSVADPSVAINLNKKNVDREYERFVLALTWVESQHNPLAVGADADFGLFQITPIRLADFNSRTGCSYTHEDCFDPIISRMIFDFYSKGLPFEEAARRWNRANNWQDSLGAQYWAKVDSILNTI